MAKAKHDSTGTQRYVAGEYGVETFNLAAALDNLAAHAEYVAGPRLLGSIGFVQSEFRVVVDVDREHTYLIAAVCTDFGHDYLVDCTGEHKAAVIVGVLADKVDTSCRGIESAFATESLGEYVADYFFKFHD